MYNSYNNKYKSDKPKKRVSLGTCPICEKGEVVENSKGWNCNNKEGDCSLFISNTYCGKKLSSYEAKKLVNMGETSIIKGMVSKKGNKFDASLVIDKEEGRVSFKFPEKEK